MSKTKKLKLTTRGRYAVTAMIELAKKQTKTPVSLVEIAQSGNISLSYLEQLFAGLRKNGLVKSYRGPGGGYILAKTANEIFITEILDSAEDCVPAQRVAKDNGGDSFGNKQTRILWDHIGSILYISMKHISLDDIINNRIENHPVTDKIFKTLK
ncbi:MAG: Rrf2 family transcriptional regulator [Alphaproteobacteria bacterium CG_4_9_14_3_um_filter_47_13]|nr:MAG: Rrf2 family transcriptional regulator [Alphaproteobacteria bacterium CG_4_9_14_3_um_filter_47_13]